MTGQSVVQEVVLPRARLGAVEVVAADSGVLVVGEVEVLLQEESSRGGSACSASSHRIPD